MLNSPRVLAFDTCVMATFFLAFHAFLDVLSDVEFCVTSPSRSGVFETPTDQRVDTFTESISFDRRLYAHDIAGSIAHAQMLADVGLITLRSASSWLRVCSRSAQKLNRAVSRCASSWKTSTCTSSRP